MRWVDANAPKSITPAQAAAVLEQAVVRHPTAQSYLQLGTALSELKRYEDAAGAFRSAVAIDSERVDAWFELGKVYAAMGRFADARETFTHVIRQAPRHAGAYGEMGAALNISGHLDEALAAYRQALALDPHNRTACQAMAIHFRRCKDAVGLLAWCDDLLQRGGYNPLVIAAKLLALAGLDQRAELQALLGLDRFLVMDYLTPPAAYASLTAFNRDVHASIKRNPSLQYEPPNTATRQGWGAKHLDITGEPLITQLTARIRQAITRYIESLPTNSDHPFARARPARAQLSIWANLLHADGYGETHLHPDGWLSGVYYVTVPELVATTTTQQGWIEFGPPPPNRLTRGMEWEHRWIQPEAGKILLFPSYIYHATIPTGVNDDRLSIAFDVVPA